VELALGLINALNRHSRTLTEFEQTGARAQAEAYRCRIEPPAYSKPARKAVAAQMQGKFPGGMATKHARSQTRR
jgi:hypothetical protein